MMRSGSKVLPRSVERVSAIRVKRGSSHTAYSTWCAPTARLSPVLVPGELAATGGVHLSPPSLVETTRTGLDKSL